MKLGGRLQAAIEVLEDVDVRHRPVADALKDWGLSHRFAGSGDRAAIGNIVYDTLRWRASSAWAIGADTPRAAVLATVARRWDLGATGIAAAIADDPHAPAALSAEETARLESAGLAAAPDHVRADVPDWLASRFHRSFGDDWVAECAALAARPPLDMRANALKADVPKVLKALARHGPAATPFAPLGVRIAPTEKEGRHPDVQSEPAFRKGWFEIQDEGSQVAALLVGATAGEQILDLCAGAGGKTLALSAAMGNRGQVFAADRDRHRLAPIFERLKRAGTRNVQVREAGASLTDLEGRMDAVLIDAPCTGTGTWRRRPDAKWRLTDRALASRVEEQDALLAGVAAFVKPGGRLVYVTCSLLPDENEDRVAAFRAASPDFEPVAGDDAIAAAGLGALAGSALTTGVATMLTPRRAGTDGFFVAVMRRRA